MLSRLKIRTKKKRLISWIKTSVHSNFQQSELVRQVEKFNRVILNYERAKQLHDKQKNSALSVKEQNELTKRLKKFDPYESFELAQIKSVYNLKRTMERRENRVSIANRIQSRQVKALILIIGILSASMITIFLQLGLTHINVSIKSNRYEADVNEEFVFSWNVEGSFSQGFILFGDGTSVELNRSSNSIKHFYATQGIFMSIIKVWNQQGFSNSKHVKIEVKNKAPQFEIVVPETVHEDELIEIKVVNVVDSEVDLEEGVIRYLYDFADNNQSTSKQDFISHKWEIAGVYPVTITLFDDQNALSRNTEYIEIINDHPEAHFEYNITEDGVEFNAESSVDTESDYNTLKYFWDFGDNHTSFGKYVHHNYVKPGEYMVELCTKDDNGAIDRITKTISIENSQNHGVKNNDTEDPLYLDVLGPYTLPQNIEGQMVNLDVEVYDSLENQANLVYSWFDEHNVLISNDMCPSVLLNDGDYRFTLNVTNQHDQTVSENVSIKVNNIVPEVFVSNYVYNGPDKGKELELVAYGYDSIFDVNKLKFYWEITDGYTNYTISDPVGKATSTMTFTPTKNAIYRGQVKVVDPSGKESVATFFVNVIIDNNKNSIPDNIEQMLDYTGESLETFTDTDNDYISDECEQLILNTNFVNPDTDGDGLCDGLDASGIGELSLGTNPLNEDSDFDLLTDSIEFFGWNVTINTFEGSKELHVSSEPLNYDTDGDYLSDHEEFLIGSNPRLVDSDGDLLEDSIDPFPTNYDQDSDYLSDKIELEIGTDLNSTDSDLDGIKDGEEYFGWSILGFKTNPLNADSDSDFASDGSEMKFYSVKLENPNNNEIRVNVSNPVSLHFPYMFQKAATAQISVALSFGEHGTNQTGEYGVSDDEVKNLTITIRHEGYDAVLFETTTNRTRHFSHVVDISEIMNNISLSYNYYGNYILEVDDPTAGCLVEQFEFEFSRYLDPNNEDFDGDGILDGVEMNLLVNGTKKADVQDQYNSTQRIVTSAAYNSNETTTYMLDIPRIGRVFSAVLYLDFESNGVIHSGTIMKVDLVKKNIDNRVKESVILDIHYQFRYERLETYSKSIDLFMLLQNDYLHDVYGEYELTFRLESLNSTQDQLILNEFSIETETFVDAGQHDSHAWLTDPSLNDTDGDGWSDSYEIFTTATNPLNEDTDGDGTIDSHDREPLKNIILEISPISASYRNQFWPTTNPWLKIGMYLQVNDLSDPNGLDENNKVGFFTSNKQTTTDIYGWDYFTYQTAWWNAGEGTHYYFDVSDDFTTQSNEVKFYFTLWESAPLGDINRFDGNWYTDTFDMGSTEPTQTLNVQQTGFWGRIDEIAISVTKTVVEKANTVAVYSKNDTLFNGHYQHQERMNVFQLHISDSGDGTPFVQGVNAIVIPTKLFTKTKLNAFIENGQLDQTVLYSDITGEFEFYSVDRDGNIADEECGDADFVFVRFEMTSQEAMELLELLLTCAVNQSLDENNQTVTDLGSVYSCVSTKLNGTDATLLNIPKTIAKFVLWGGGYEDSPYGSVPETVSPFFILFLLVPFVLPIAGLINLFAYTIDRVTQFNNENAEGTGLTLLTFLANLLWTLIRAALIIIAYICLAIEVIITTAIFLALGGVFTLFSLLSDMTNDWGINWAIPYGVNTKIAFLNINIEENQFEVDVWINWVYWEFFDMFFPIPIIDFDMDTLVGKKSIEPVPPSINCGYEQIGGENSTLFDFQTVYMDDNGNEPDYVKLFLMGPDGVESSFLMTNKTLITNEALILTGVEYNVTIDFRHKSPGQYFYYFETRELSEQQYLIRWPVNYYCEPGPYISIDGKQDQTLPYFIFSGIDYKTKYENELVNFEVTGGDFVSNLVPSNVNINFLWNNGSIQSFPMNAIESYCIEFENNTKVTLTTYSININFTKYITIDKPQKIYCYYSADFETGGIATFFDSYQENNISEEIREIKKSWFLGPTIIPFKSIGLPQIIGWKVEEVISDTLYDSRTNSRCIIGPTVDEHVLRFWVFISDPDGTHEDHKINGFSFMPQLKLSNLNDPNAQETYIPLAWAGNDYNPFPGVDAYFVDVLPYGSYTYDHENFTDCSFGSGAWKFSFLVNDNYQFTVEEEARVGLKTLKIWNIGSLAQIWFTAMNGYNSAGFLLDKIVPGAGLISSIGMAIGYGLAGLLSLMGEKCKTVARFISIGIVIYDLVSTLSSWIALCFTDDTGTLLGLALSCIMTSAGIALAHKLGTLNSNLFDFKNLNIMNKITKFAFLINFILSIYCNPTILLNSKIIGIFLLPGSGNEFDWDAPGEDLIRNAPINVLSFFISFMGLGAILNIASMKTLPFFGSSNDNIIFGSVKCPVLQITKYHTIIKLTLAAICFITFMTKSGMFHILGDLSLNSILNSN